MDFDLAQVRAFVKAVEHRHFGRAAAELLIAQQSLSKRIQRLEHMLGQPLLLRDRRGVELTDAGERFLPYARRLLSLADAAALVSPQRGRPLRVDVWGHVQAPAQLVRRLVERTPVLRLELSMRRSLDAAIQALRRGEIDAAFGRAHDLGHDLPAALARRPVILARAGAAVSAQHPLAGADVLRPADLQPYGLWLGASGPPEMVGWFRRYAEHFDLGLDLSDHHLGLDDVLEGIRREPARVALIGADGPDRAGVRRIRLDPTPCFAWSLVWRRDDRHPLLVLLHRLIADTGRDEGWLVFDAERDWLPDADRRDVEAATSGA
jgi:DNA-binding transcriptional LysR family regulator